MIQASPRPGQFRHAATSGETGAREPVPVGNGFGLLAFLCVTLLWSLAAGAQDWEEQARRIQLERASRMVVMLDGSLDNAPVLGAGLIVGFDAENIYIATANHVVRRGEQTAETLQVTFRDRSEAIAAVLLPGHESALDLAVVAAPRRAIRDTDPCALHYDRLRYRRNGVVRGTPVFSIGNPNGMGWAVPVTADYVSGLRDGLIRFQSNFIAPGSSGGALVDENGLIVGMLRADTPPFAEAVAIREILHALGAMDVPVDLHELPDLDPLSNVVEAGDTAGLRRLIDAGCRVEDAVVPLLDFGPDPPMLEILLDAGIDPQTGIRRAARHGKLASMRTLVARGASLTGSEGLAALDSAVTGDEPRMIAFIFENGGFGTETVHAVMELVLKNSTKPGPVTRALFDGIAGSIGPETASDYLCESIERTKYDVIHWLIRLGADVNRVFSCGDYPFSGISALKNRGLVGVDAPKVAAFGALVDAGLDVNRLDAHGNSLLHFFVSDGYDKGEASLRYIRKLLDAGADPNRQNSGRAPSMAGWSDDQLGATPLHALLYDRRTRFHVAAVKLLLDAGADPDLRDQSGRAGAEMVEWIYFAEKTDPKIQAELAGLLPKTD